MTRFDHSESRRFSIEGGKGRGARNNCPDEPTRRRKRRRGRRDRLVGALGNGYASSSSSSSRMARPTERRERERERTVEEREAEELLKEATRNPRRRLTGRPVFSYGRHMVCTRWPKGLAAAAAGTLRAEHLSLFESGSVRVFLFTTNYIICDSNSHCCYFTLLCCHTSPRSLRTLGYENKIFTAFCTHICYTHKRYLSLSLVLSF